jgi:hypothetical protein
MALTIEQMTNIKTELVDTVHSNRIVQQGLDDEFFWDTFKLPAVKNQRHIIRLGAAADLVNGVTGQIITSNPQVFYDPVKDTSAAQEKASRISRELNRQARNLLKQDPQSYHEFVKDELVMGEGWLHVTPNQMLVDWDKKEMGGEWQEIMPEAMPTKYYIVNPMVIFLDPSEVEDGIISRLVVAYDRTVGDLMRSFPEWTKKGRRKDTDKVSFWMYIDEEVRYAEAGGKSEVEALFRDGRGELANGEGIQENIFKKVPFFHAYSGFGKGSVDNDPSTLAVSRLRFERGKMVEDETLRSDLSLMINKYAYKYFNVINRSGSPLGEDAFKEFSTEAGTINELNLPIGADFQVAEDLIPDAQAFNYYGSVHAEVLTADPPTLRGYPSGTSGRQEDILGARGRNLYDSVVINTEQTFAQAFSHSLLIMETLPDMLPPTIKKGDISKHYKCEVKLKAADAIADDRKSMAGRAMVQAGQISLRTNLIQFQGMTEDEADKEIARMLAERYMFGSPDIADLLARRAAEKSVMGEELSRIQGENKDLVRKQGERGGQPRTENIQTARGAEQAMSRTQGGLRGTPSG